LETEMADIEVHQWSTLEEALWLRRGVVFVNEPRPLLGAVTKLAGGPGVYRARPIASLDPWSFYYVQENGQVQDTGAASRID
jgi:hypothetical protein